MTRVRFPSRGAPASIAAPPATRVAPVRRGRSWGHGWDAAKLDGVLAGLSGVVSAINDDVRGDYVVMRGRVRGLRKNSALVARLEQLVRVNIVGPDGPTLDALPGNARNRVNAALKAQLEDAWYTWAEAASVDGGSLTDALGTAVAQWRTEGEGALRIVRDPSLPFGIGLQAFDTARIDERVNRTAQGALNAITMGVEHDANGRPVAYYLRRSMRDGEPSTAVPASDVLMLRHAMHPEQIRGVPPLAPTVILLEHFEKLQQALVVLHRITAAKMGVFVRQRGTDADPLSLDPDGPDDREPIAWDLTPGLLDYAPDGYDLKLFDPGQPTQQYDAMAKQMLHELASAWGVSYPSLTGDLSTANYGSQRGGLQMERDGWVALQTEVISHVLSPLYRQWLMSAVLTGAVVLPSADMRTAMRHEFHGRRWDWIDPLKDAQAMREMLDLKMTSRTRILNKLGLSFTTVLDEIEAETREAEARGITLAPTPPTGPGNGTDDDSSDDSSEDSSTAPGRATLRAIA